MTRQAAVIRFGLLLIGVLMAGVPARAEQIRSETPQPPQNPIVTVKDYPWSAIGKLNNGASGSCTTVLISRQYALTAAHCLFFKPTGRFLPAQSLHLVFGFESGQFTEHLRVSSYHVPSTYDPRRPYETLASDWALLLISGEPSAATRPLDIEQHIRPAAAPNLMAPGYAKQTPYRMTADRQCHFVGHSSDGGLLFDSCKVFEGYSGGPVLIQNPGKHSVSVAGIHVGNQVWQGRPIAVAISSEVIWREIKPCLMSKECKFQHVATGRDATAAEVLAGLSDKDNENRFELTSSPLCAANDSNCKPADQ